MRAGFRIARQVSGLTLGLALLGFAASASAASVSVTDGLVLDHVTVVDTHDGRLSPDRAVVVVDGRIARILAARDVTVGGSARLVDARGKFLVPGFNDMHAHPVDSPDPEGDYAMMLVNGITGVRQMSGSPDLLQARRDGKLMPYAAAPEILAMPGTILTFANAGTVDLARAEVDRQKAEGADFIKTISVSPPVFFAALDEANKVGLPYVGHLSQGVSATQASKDGMRSIEHLGPIETLLINCSSDEDAIWASLAHPAAPPVARLDLNALPKGMDRRQAVANPVLSEIISDPTALPRIEHVADTFSEAKCREAAKVFITHDTWQVPTLIRLRRMLFGDDPQYVNDPDLRYLPPGSRQLWKTVDQQFADQVTPGDRAILTKLWLVLLKTTMIFDQAGVRMMAGSDVVGGFSLHHEFDLLGEAGLSPLTVLQMTTLNGAEFLGREKTMGSVMAGKDANLVLLDANPIASVQNLHRIFAVVRAGTYYSRSDLDALAAHTEERMKTPAVAALPAPDDL